MINKEYICLSINLSVTGIWEVRIYDTGDRWYKENKKKWAKDRALGYTCGYCWALASTSQPNYRYSNETSGLSTSNHAAVVAFWTLEVCSPAIRTYNLLILAFLPKSCDILAHSDFEDLATELLLSLGPMCGTLFRPKLDNRVTIYYSSRVNWNHFCSSSPEPFCGSISNEGPYKYSILLLLLHVQMLRYLLTARRVMRSHIINSNIGWVEFSTTLISRWPGQKELQRNSQYNYTNAQNAGLRCLVAAESALQYP